ncbi:MAG: TraR/DksA C4-type zinc finger protein [Desulfuromonadaceae bacterium]|nr:TraR/DksA C4-type zinc finger protein [Desulfuromonadaceae bacterium]
MDKTEECKNLDVEFFQQLLLKRFGALRQLKSSGQVKSEEERIEVALSRIRWGNYKRCMDCSEEIDDERLLVDPTTLVCLKCSTTKTT